MSSAAVNRPTDPKLRDADINKKLQVYGIYSAFANGKAPSNQQIDVALNSTLNSKALATPSPKLSAEGQKLVGDVRNVIEQAKQLILSKNEGNLIQDFIWQTQTIDASGASKPGMPVDKDTAKQHGNEALDGLKTLGTLIITNGQFRKLLSDATVLLRDMAGDAAQKASSKINPDQEKLDQIDQPADDNTWHDTPNVSKDNLKSQMNSRLGRNTDTEAAKQEAQAEAQDVADHAQASAEGQPTKSDAAAAAANVGGQKAKDKVASRISDEDKELARKKRDEAKQRGKDYLDKKVPKERRDQTIYRLKKMIVEIQGHSDYQRAIETLLRLAETYGGHSKDLGAQSKGTVKGAHQDDSLNTAEADLKILIERFANGTSSDDLFDAINQIYRDADADPELKQYFRDLDKYIRRALQEQGWVLKDEANEEYNRLYDQGKYLLREKYKSHTDRILDEFKYLGEQFDKDPQNRAFAESMDKLFKDLGQDENGQPAFKPHLLRDLRDVILPAFFENIQYIPIPRIEYSDPAFDAVVENLVIEGDNLAPNVMEFGSDNYWRWGRKQIANRNKNSVMLSVSGVQMDIRDVSYYVKRKDGFPKITDQGVMDLFMGGSGFSFKAALETADPSDKQHFFKIKSVVVDVKNLNIKLKQSRYKLLFGLFKPLLLKVMSPVVQKVLEKVIRDKITEVDAFLYSIKVEVDKSKEDIKRNPDPENVQSVYKMWADAFNKKMAEGKQKKEELKEKTADKHVNVAMTQHDSLFKNVKLPGGVSSKATEYKDLAAKGEKWESPVFSIGSASASSSIPKAPTVSRRTGGTGTNVPSSSGTGPTTTTAVPASTLPPTNGGQVNGSTGFSNQVNNAFDSNTKPNDLYLNYNAAQGATTTT